MLAERCGELGSGAREALAHGLRADAEDLGDLGGLHALDADQQGDLAIGRRERREGAVERALGLRVRECLEWRALGACDICARQIPCELVAYGLRSHPADHEAMRDREQPCPDPGLWSEHPGVL